MSEKKKGGKEFDNPYSVAKAVTKGNALTKLSMVVLGLGNIAHHQIIKGLGMLAIEIAFIVNQINLQDLSCDNFCKYSIPLYSIRHA